jgi:hypothetical protein
LGTGEGWDIDGEVCIQAVEFLKRQQENIEGPG